MEGETTLDAMSLKALGADTRQDILKELKERPHTASELSRHLDKHITTIKEHLDMLVESGLVDRNERKGRKWVYYSLSRKGDKLFKPSYSWVVVLGLSVVCILSGVFTSLPASVQMAGKTMTTDEAAEVSREAANAAWSLGAEPWSILLIVAGVAGLGYVLYNHFKK